MINKVCYTILLAIIFISKTVAQSTNQPLQIPKVYANVYVDSVGKLYVQKDGNRIYEKPTAPKLLLQQAIAKISADKNGLALDFKKENFSGLLYAGFIPYGDSKHPIPVYIRNEYMVKNGKSFISIKNDFKGNRDFVKWNDGKPFTIGYRLVDDKGVLMYDGKISLAYKDSAFVKLPTVIEGPFVTNITPEDPRAP